MVLSGGVGEMIRSGRGCWSGDKICERVLERLSDQVGEGVGEVIRSGRGCWRGYQIRWERVLVSQGDRERVEEVIREIQNGKEREE